MDDIYLIEDKGIIRDIDYAVSQFNLLFNLKRSSVEAPNTLERTYFEVTATHHEAKQWMFHLHEVADNLEGFQRFNLSFGAKDRDNITGIIGHAVRELMYPDMRPDVPFEVPPPLVIPKVYLCAEPDAASRNLEYYVRIPEDVMRMQDSSYALRKDFYKDYYQ
jgi:hypothetical protein